MTRAGSDPKTRAVLVHAGTHIPQERAVLKTPRAGSSGSDPLSGQFW